LIFECVYKRCNHAPSISAHSWCDTSISSTNKVLRKLENVVMKIAVSFQQFKKVDFVHQKFTKPI